MQQVKSVGVFNGSKLYGVADTATKAITTDSDLGSVTELASFAKGAQGPRLGRREHGDPARPVRPPRTPTASSRWRRPTSRSGARSTPTGRSPASATKQSAGDKGDASKIVK